MRTDAGICYGEKGREEGEGKVGEKGCWSGDSGGVGGEAARGWGASGRRRLSGASSQLKAPELGDQGLCGQVRRGQRLTTGLEATEDSHFLTDRLCHQPPDLWGRSTIPAPALGAWVRVLTPQGSSFLPLRGLGHRYCSPPGTTGGSNGPRLTGALRAELSPPYRHFPRAGFQGHIVTTAPTPPPPPRVCVHLWSLPLPSPVPVRLSLISATEIPPRKT